MSHIPELLLPAGNLEKLKFACLYGADAVYLSGQSFGLRAASDNFTEVELKKGVEFAHYHDVRVHVVLNGYLHDEDFETLGDFVKYLEQINVDALIISDIGVVKFVSSLTNIPIHLSTQASCLNEYSGLFWKELGVSRLILGREVSIEEAKQIKRTTGLEVELFIHGSMCMAYSGHCVISNYTAGRDSNRGGCAHSCRFDYELKNENEVQTTTFMSSKDLKGLEYIPQFVDAEIDSMKVEGRMKSPIYAGTVARSYREAIDAYMQSPDLFNEKVGDLASELSKLSHRDYTEASLISAAGESSIYREENAKEGEYVVVGQVVEAVKDEYIIIQVRKKFAEGDQLEFLPFKEKHIHYQASSLSDLSGDRVSETKPSTLVKMSYIPGIEKHNIVRRRVS